MRLFLMWSRGGIRGLRNIAVCLVILSDELKLWRKRGAKNLCKQNIPLKYKIGTLSTKILRRSSSAC